MKTTTLVSLVMLLLVTDRAGAHGFGLSVNNYASPTVLNVSTETDYLDLYDITPNPYANLFISNFNANLTSAMRNVAHVLNFLGLAVGNRPVSY